MELPSLHHNGRKWSPKVLGENALLLEPEEKGLEQIHDLTSTIETARFDGVIDLVPAYSSLGVTFDRNLWNHISLIQAIEQLPERRSTKKSFQDSIEVPVCYELGLDWNEVLEYTELTKEEVIESHCSRRYTIAMMGFIPGFVFLDGLDEALTVPRKSTPRTVIPEGSVGIGGNQTGIYSLESPGGWNIIGRTSAAFFDSSKNPPTNLKAGDLVKFIPISKEEFYNG